MLGGVVVVGLGLMGGCFKKSTRKVFSSSSSSLVYYLSSSGLVPGSNSSRRSFGTSRRKDVKISPTEATAILTEHEHSEEVSYNSVKGFDSNQLASNNPVEDARAEGKTLYTTGMLFGVFDGHGGPSCCQVVAKRVFNYIAASLLPPSMIRELFPPPGGGGGNVPLMEFYNDNFELVEDLSKLYHRSFSDFLQELQDKEKMGEFDMSEALKKSFLSLDAHISTEAKLGKGDPAKKVEQDALETKTLSVALSGSVGAVAHVDGEHLHVASVGDCRVVLGVYDVENETWSAHVLTEDHNSENVKEVARILSEHPPSERDSIIRNDRLFGQLVPLRAWGDVRFKWSPSDVREFLVPLLGEAAVVPSSLTPPYLTAAPDVTYHKLRAAERFMILGTDGLWDLLSPSQAVTLVGEHMCGKITLKPFNLPEGGATPSLGSLHSTLSSRMNASRLKPIDGNAATHLIRHALGGTEHGVDHKRLSGLLTMPDDVVRLFRDDITATIVFFDTEYLANRPL